MTDPQAYFCKKCGAVVIALPDGRVYDLYHPKNGCAEEGYSIMAIDDEIHSHLQDPKRD